MFNVEKYEISVYSLYNLFKATFEQFLSMIMDWIKG